MFTYLKYVHNGTCSSHLTLSGFMLTLWGVHHHGFRFKDEETEDKKGGTVWPSSHSNWQNQRVNFSFADTQKQRFQTSAPDATPVPRLWSSHLLFWGKKSHSFEGESKIPQGHPCRWFLLCNHLVWRSQRRWIPRAWEFLESHWFTSLFLSHRNMLVLERCAFTGMLKRKRYIVLKMSRTLS